MTHPAIKVQGLWKEYAVNKLQEQHGTFYDLLAHTLKSPFKRLRGMGRQTEDFERFWALQDINFEVQPGEVVGVIGRNGAGKSTLLKLLSRITAPSKGRIAMRGRLASLLEVGTGFHPELSGRENIFLNGAILGMTRNEVAGKFDEILEFAEIEKFIDTPVKHYSSGMYVRLAFAVAAHLEPDILVVDEVLAVGDGAFQKKCLGKLRAVAGYGRTVLLVSHNMNAIQALCGKCILLDHGKIATFGETKSVIDNYLKQAQDGMGTVHTDKKVLELRGISGEYRLEGDGSRVNITVILKAIADVEGLYIDFGLENASGVRLLQINQHEYGAKPASLKSGAELAYHINCCFPELAPSEYFCTLYAHSLIEGGFLYVSQVRLFNVAAREEKRESMSSGFTAVMLPKFEIRIEVGN